MQYPTRLMVGPSDICPHGSFSHGLASVQMGFSRERMPVAISRKWQVSKWDRPVLKPKADPVHASHGGCMGIHTSGIDYSPIKGYRSTPGSCLLQGQFLC